MTSTLADPALRDQRLARVDERHVRALNVLVRSWRGSGRAVPWFDPADGGVGAQVLVLMESPGPATVREGDRGFCSEDNSDPSAAALRGARERSGLRRDCYVRWNVVPWALLDEAGRLRAPAAGDVEAASASLSVVLDLLPELRLVVCAGSRALSGLMRVLTLDSRPLPYVLGVPHPSPQNARARAETLRRLENALRRGAELCDR